MAGARRRSPWLGGARLAVAAIALLGAAHGCSGNGAAAGSMEPAELAARIAEGTAPFVLDVRTPQEFAAGHIPGSMNIPHDALADRLAEIEVSRDQEIVVHCERGGRAAAAEAVLRDAGYTRVRDLVGHMETWRARGLPTE